jgi:hypothetical protein
MPPAGYIDGVVIDVDGDLVRARLRHPCGRPPIAASTILNTRSGDDA